jgi:crotonobetainyl-CoA:carnitine CoA-transferase CaiB-like acyl-CoA transferase
MASVSSKIEKWTKRRTPAEVFKQLQKSGVKAAMVEDMKDLFADPQLKYRKFWAPTYHPEVSMRKAPFLFSRTPSRIDRAAPMIGKHNELVFKE